MTAARSNDDLHDLVDRLSPHQADAVPAMLRLIVPRGGDADAGLPAEPVRRLSFAGTLSAEPDFAERSEEILADLTRTTG